MKILKKSVIFATATTFILLLFQMGCSKKEEIYKLGAILPLTGSAAIVAEYLKNGIDLAIEKINSEGIIPKGKLEIVYGDSKNSPKEAISILNRFISVEKIPITIAAVSSVSLALIPIADDNQHVLFITVASAPGIPEKSEWAFRIFPTSENEARKMANYAYSSLHLKRLAIFYVNDEYGLGGCRIFIKEFEKIGGKVIWKESYEKTQIDFRSQLVKIKATSPDSVWIIGYDSSLASIIKQVREIGIQSKILTIIGFSLPKVLEQSGKASEGIFLTLMPFDPDIPVNDMSKKFVSNYYAKYNAKPGFMSAISFDMTMVLADVLKRYKYSPNDIKNGLLDLKSYQGILGEISITKNGEVDFSLDIGIVKNGKIIRIKN
jgi:branched-chain amino acid transport system substrate-binding protein